VTEEQLTIEKPRSLHFRILRGLFPVNKLNTPCGVLCVLTCPKSTSYEQFETEVAEEVVVASIHPGILLLNCLLDLPPAHQE